MKALVDAGKLPAVKDRLPKEPLVYKTGNMKEGMGVYGDVMRYVIGGRPEGWNYWAGQSQGWGGIDIRLQKCLTRTGPLFQRNAEELAPLPNLAKSIVLDARNISFTFKVECGVVKAPPRDCHATRKNRRTGPRCRRSDQPPNRLHQASCARGI